MIMQNAYENKAKAKCADGSDNSISWKVALFKDSSSGPARWFHWFFLYLHILSRHSFLHLFLLKCLDNRITPINLYLRYQLYQLFEKTLKSKIVERVADNKNRIT